ncbi:hypothetical protein ACQP3J_32405, partial [Escherichia coli]
ADQALSLLKEGQGFYSGGGGEVFSRVGRVIKECSTRQELLQGGSTSLVCRPNCRWSFEKQL